MVLVPDNRVSLRNSMYKKVRVTEVNMKKFYIETSDQIGASYRVEISSHPGLVRIPRAGEDWIINRIDNIWKLAYRYDDKQEVTLIENLLPGDVRIEGDRIYINGQILFNRIPYFFTRTVYNEVPNGLIDGVNSLFSTLRPYLSKTLRVYHNGLLTVEFEEIGNLLFDLLLIPQDEDQIVVEYDYDPAVGLADEVTQEGIEH